MSKIIIGKRPFQTKQAAQQAVRAVLWRYQPGDIVQNDDAAFLLDLLRLHPHAQQKLGAGVHSFQVEAQGRSRGFWLTRLDGSRTDFSYRACLAPPTREAQALAGLRWAVRPQVETFRESAFEKTATLTCPVSGETLAPGNSHVDHDPPFRNLVDAFLQDIGRELGSLLVLPTLDGETITELVEPDVIEAWQRFHAWHASLRIVSAKANLRRPRHE
ncbi:MAG TPA: DCL family protein [Anaerolineales bacterium]|nr:DCL family protein [Anaerolineales bacterium]